jgi:hypothetical protein
LPGEWANNSTFRKNAGEKSRKSAEILCAMPAQQMANNDEREPHAMRWRASKEKERKREPERHQKKKGRSLRAANA